MMTLLFYLTFWLVFKFVAGAQVFYSSNPLVNDYSKYSSSEILGQLTSDEATTSLKDDKNMMTFTASASSYFYTTFPCETATALAYDTILFPIKGPSGATFELELRTKKSCSTTDYMSHYYTLPSAMSGGTQTVRIPLSPFFGTNSDVVSILLFKSFSRGDWEIGATELVYDNKAQFSAITAKSIGGAVAFSSSSVARRSIPVALSSTNAKTFLSSRVVSLSSGSCNSLLIDDFASQSRLTFLFYNAMLQPSSDDGTMKPVTGRADTSTSVIVSNNHAKLTPASSSSYFYSMFNCLGATGVYGGIGLTISAPAGTVITIELQTAADCSSNNLTLIDVSSTSLGWTFDGTERFYNIDFTKFPGLDTDHLISLLFTGFTKAVTLGPMAFYCGTSGTQYPLPTTVAVVEPSSTIPATSGPSTFVIDTFGNANTNNKGFYHGGDDSTTYKITNNRLNISTNGNSDLAWYTQLSNSCTDLTPNDGGYFHFSYTGSNAFTIALQQHNPTCNESLNPIPYTWDSVEASRYSNDDKTDIYIPISHFNINRKATIGIALKGFYSTTSTIISMIEIVQTVPSNFLVPSKLDTAPLISACTRPNSFAFAIDDGEPKYAQEVIGYLKAANIKATFFTVGAALLDQTTNLTNVYSEMLSLGHQVAYHSFTHPPMEGLPSLAAIDWELNNDIAAVQSQLGISSKYFRPPFGTEGARIRQRLAALIPGSKFVEWSVDVEDYLYALSTTPEKQLSSFQRDVDKGGNLVVCHYLYATTVSYIPRLIEIAKKTGKQLMRVDQCLEDPDAPPL